jgi:hypothetical protein
LLGAWTTCGAWAAEKSNSASQPAAAYTFTVTVAQINPGIKRAIVVRLDRRITEAQLRDLAIRLKAMDSRQYERTFITYYLPHMPIGSGAWATTHFEPSLTVKILGLTIEQFDNLVRMPVPAGRKLVGRWINESPSWSFLATIFEQGGKLFLEQRFDDDGANIKELVEEKHPGGRLFRRAEGSRAGDHYIVTRSGDLEIRDNDGLISKPIRVGKGDSDASRP